MLTNSKKMLHAAKENNFAIPAPNFIDLDSARIFTNVAEANGLPLILPFAQAHADILPLDEAALIGKYLANKVTVPIALHLDHGTDFDFIIKAIELGFTSVMIDASTTPFSENISVTKEVVAFAHKRNVTVEAELGHVGAGQNYENHETTDSVYTEVDDVLKFVKQTQIDSLAISIGTAHGNYKGTPKLNFDRLKDINRIASIPLVLHGGSSSGDSNLESCALNGINKINIFTDLLNGAYNKIKQENPVDYLGIKSATNIGMENILTHYYQIFHTKKI